MDYYEIGQRIRKYRKAQDISQEKLAELADISVTHMSHIETGNTKASLAVFVSLAEALAVRTDDLLYDEKPVTLTSALEDISEVLNSCTPNQAKILVDLVKAAKISMDKHL